MSLSDLQNQGLIKPIKVSTSQVRARLVLAQRDIATARKLLGSDPDWAFSIAYNAVLQSATALMFSKGYRPTAREGHHVATVRFAEVALGKELDDIAIFDKMRQKRHRIIYDVAGAVSLQEAKAAFRFAINFVERITKVLHE